MPARTKPGNTICSAMKKLNFAPIEKKNKIKKNSLTGLSPSAMTRAIGDAPRVIPVINAPISYESPKSLAVAAPSRHHPKDIRKI